MDLEELAAAFKPANVLLVKVEDLNDSVDSRSLRVSGELADYIAAAKALNSPVVFAYAETLDAEDFLYFPDDTDEEDDSEEQDLCAVNPDLEEFKRYIGRVGRVTLYLPTSPEGLTYVVANTWYDKFLERRDAATGSVDQRYEDAQAERDQAKDKRLSALTARLDDLVNDRKFVRLPTQKAMLAYAKVNIPGIAELDGVSLKNAISDLAARILVKSGD
jgi:hypothetical protein